MDGGRPNLKHPNAKPILNSKFRLRVQVSYKANALYPVRLNETPHHQLKALCCLGTLLPPHNSLDIRLTFTFYRHSNQSLCQASRAQALSKRLARTKLWSDFGATDLDAYVILGELVAAAILEVSRVCDRDPRHVVSS